MKKTFIQTLLLMVLVLNCMGTEKISIANSINGSDSLQLALQLKHLKELPSYGVIQKLVESMNPNYANIQSFSVSSSLPEKTNTPTLPGFTIVVQGENLQKIELPGFQTEVLENGIYRLKNLTSEITPSSLAIAENDILASTFTVPDDFKQAIKNARHPELADIEAISFYITKKELLELNFQGKLHSKSDHLKIQKTIQQLLNEMFSNINLSGDERIQCQINQNKFHFSMSLSLQELEMIIKSVINKTAEARKIAKEKACRANRKVINGALEMYDMDNPSSTPLPIISMDDLIKDSYLRKQPTCPETKEKYILKGIESFCSHHKDQ